MWQLVQPVRTDRFRIRGALVYDQQTGLPVIGSGGVLETREVVTADDIAAAEHYWPGGYTHTTTDPAIRDLWLANGYEVLNV